MVLSGGGGGERAVLRFIGASPNTDVREQRVRGVLVCKISNIFTIQLIAPTAYDGEEFISEGHYNRYVVEMFGDSFVSASCIGMSCLSSIPSLHTYSKQPLFYMFLIV